jgi:type IV pilus assembly protein PilO
MNKKFLISLLLSVGIVGGYIYMFSDNTANAKKTSQKTEAEIQEEINAIQAKIYDLKAQGSNDELDIEIKKLKQEVMQASSMFPREIGITSLLKDVSIIGESSGLQILLFQPMEAINEGIYEEIPIKLKIRGTYKQVASFFYGISSLERVIKIQDMKITGPINNSGIIMTESELMITTYRIIGGE